MHSNVLTMCAHHVVSYYKNINLKSVINTVSGKRRPGNVCCGVREERNERMLPRNQHTNSKLIAKVWNKAPLNKQIHVNKLEKVAIIAMYCHSRPPDAIAFPILYLFGLQIWAADEPNAVSFRVAVGATLMPHRGCGVRWTVTKRNSEGGVKTPVRF